MRVDGHSSNERLTDISARIVISFVLAALAGVLLDTSTRTTWTGVSLWTHIVASSGLFLAIGAIAGATVAVAVSLLRALPFRRWHRIVVACLVALELHATFAWFFGGRFARSSSVASWAPYALSALCALAVFTIASAVLRAHDDASSGRWRRPLVVAAIAAVVSALLVAADLTLLVSLYGRLHTLLETSAAFACAIAVALLLSVLSTRRPRTATVTRGVAVAVVAWALLFMAIPPLRRAHERALRHTWREPVYAGRMLRRVQMAEASFGLRADVSALQSAPLHLLRERFDIEDTTLHPRWRSAQAEPVNLQHDLATLREGKTDFDIVVYYVDTLRQDVASDEEVMPELARFSRGAMNFRHAYAPGSDTLHSLPGLVGGRYRMDETCSAALLPTARRAKVPSSLFIPESAYQFLSTLLPSFAFDRVQRVPDHRDPQSVWGYGADKATAGPLVDGVLEWLDRERPARHVTWLFNFDLHNWRELERSYVDDVAARYAVPEEGAWNWQYRVVARSIDAEFRRLLDGLERRGRADRTIVLFVSDHGEGLGYQGFWVHSIFLWESLVRVPLLLRVPGHPSAKIDETVSLVDVAPTLSRFIDPRTPIDDCHGTDLLAYLSPHRPPRRRPALLVATNEGQLSKLGVVDGDRKLVLPLDWGEPQLYDLTFPEPDEADVAEGQPSHVANMVDELVRSPIFERSDVDERVRAALSKEPSDRR